MTYRFLSLSYNRALSLLLDEENKIISPFNPRNFHSIKYFQNGYKDQIRRINSYCKERGFKLVVIKQAFFINLDVQKNINSLSKEEIIDELISYNKEKEYPNVKNLFWMYTNAILNKNLDELAAEDDSITLVDPTKSLYAKNKLDFFQKDGIHLNLQGNQVIANKIFESLISKQLIKK